MNESVFDLPVVKRLSEHVSERLVGELPVIVVDHARVRGAVALQGAHLIAWQPAGHEAVLWLSDASAFVAGTAIRGGVPVCWPWFGPAGKPSHGFARTSVFELVAHSEDEYGVELSLRLTSSESTLAIWPHEFELLIGFRLGGEECEVTLEARGEFESTGALHSYFNVGDIDGVSVSGIGAPYVDKVEETDGVQVGALTFPGRIDRIYTAPETVSLVAEPALRRVIEVRHHGHSDVVTWNPGPELSKSMGDLTDEGYREFCCVETARISAPMVSTAGQAVRLGTTIRVNAG